jgi:hypothetical protein
MQENNWVQICWTACVGTAIVASGPTILRRRARYVGRVEGSTPLSTGLS